MTDEWDNGFTVRLPAWHADRTGAVCLADHPGTLKEALPLGFPRRDGRPGHWEPIAARMFDERIKIIDGLAPTDEVRKAIATLKAAGADDVSLRYIEGGPVTEYVAVEGWQLVKRDDDDECVLSAPTESYEVVNHELFTDVLEACVEAGFKTDTMGSTREGREIFCTLLLDEPITIAGDDSHTFAFVVASSSHDGSRAFRVGPMWFRYLCANTIDYGNMIWDSGQVPSFTFRHSANVMDRVEEAKQVLAGLREATTAYVELSNQLAAMPCLDDQLTEFLERAMPMPEALDGKSLSDRKRNNVLGARGTVRSLYEESLTTEAHRGTALGLVEATVEYLDHFKRSISDETLVRRTILEPEPFKKAAITLAMEVCAS